ncbi:ABC transporter permease [Phytoactinopolyspora mesophila]|uniref:ABC transporter permease n=1 Tax=Phytoactinopolyspora mesophila TaxID=2650750 RepID=A0A7K3M8I4_9ACTN|nr:ABC transporter permease [Phytoactinopolyspora mesophila]NDL59615.1 ABC transporter permease [Phytoactinopolyspora mesophila]
MNEVKTADQPTDDSAVPASTPAGRTARGIVRQQLQQILAFASLIVLVAFFALANDNFLTWSNVTGILVSTAVIGILALGTTYVIITGGIELSLGTGMTLAAVMTGVFLVNLGWPLYLGVLGGVLTGALIGLVNGFNIAFLKIPPFIATLAMMMIAQGLALVISGTAPIYFTDVSGFTGISQGSAIPGVDIPNAVLILFSATIVAALILGKSILGRFTFAIGSNEEAAVLSGINVRKWKIIIYTLSGAFMGIAGVVLAARLNSAQPAIGVGYELQAIAAVVIGGTSLQGGKGSIVGTLIGALIVGTVTNGLRIMSIPQEWQTVIIGLVILLAVYTDILRRGKQG